MSWRRVTVMAWLAGLAIGTGACGNFSGKAFFDQTEDLSDCGGFGQIQSPLLADPPPYCDAEVLHWAYTPAQERLTLTDARVELNCCGIHHLTLDWEDGVYLATETDEPEFGDARCGCMCVFDFTVAATGVPEETIHLRLVRTISDWAEESGTVWEGDLDLSLGAGFVVLDTTPSMWCEVNP
jgi:hypothetical protein